MKAITKEFLEKHNACSSGMSWVTENKLIGLAPKEFIDTLMSNDKFGWANWLIVRLMNKKQKVQYAIFAAEQVLYIFEKKYPGDLRPRKAIEAAKEYLTHPFIKTKRAAYAAATAAAYAADAAYAAATAAAYAADAYAAAAADAYAAAAAADAAAYAADAAYAAATAADAAYAAAYAATAAADAAYARKQMQITIINYGLSLI